VIGGSRVELEDPGSRDWSTAPTTDRTCCHRRADARAAAHCFVQASMKAAVLRGDSPSLVITEVATPTPGPGEVLIEVAACGVCHTDLHVMKGEVAFPRPAVLGHEVSGRIAALGKDVAGLAVGDEVACSFMMPCGTCRHCVAGHDDLCSTFFAFNRLRGTLYDGRTRLFDSAGEPIWMYSMGGLAQYCVVPSSDVFVVPEGVDLADVAIVGCSSFTAFGAVHNVARLTMVDRIAVVAVGGVGLSIIQFARAAGVSDIVAVDVENEKLAAATRAGASTVINSRTHDPVEVVQDLTHGRGLDVAFEALGSPQTFSLCLHLLGDGGRAVIVGIAAAGRTGEVDLARIVRRKLQILGSYGGRARTDMPHLLELVRRGVVRPSELITTRVPLSRADEAYRQLAAGKVVGRAIVEMASP
jgi:S-(hydroxymethyl)glutathione dehydrogenase/alcohol dehydrogenase